MNKIDLQHLASYDEDFALWSAEQGALLRSGKLDRADLENIAEEIESLGRSDKREIQSRMTVILVHLLKWQFQPELTPNNSWAASILRNRLKISKLVEESPSLAGYPQSVLADAYRAAPLDASGETGLPLATFPQTSPYTIEQVLDENYWPGPAPR